MGRISAVFLGVAIAALVVIFRKLPRTMVSVVDVADRPSRSSGSGSGSERNRLAMYRPVTVRAIDVRAGQFL